MPDLQSRHNEGRYEHLFYGFYDDCCYTLEGCGAKFGVTRERIRQIESKALRNLKRILSNYEEVY